jgi:hypothetical protein
MQLSKFETGNKVKVVSDLYPHYFEKIGVIEQTHYNPTKHKEEEDDSYWVRLLDQDWIIHANEKELQLVN